MTVGDQRDAPGDCALLNAIRPRRGHDNNSHPTESTINLQTIF